MSDRHAHEAADDLLALERASLIREENIHDLADRLPSLTKRAARWKAARWSVLAFLLGLIAGGAL